MAQNIKSARELFDMLADSLSKNPDRAREIGSQYEFIVGGEGGGHWLVDLNRATVATWNVDAPPGDVTISVHHADFMNMLNNPAMGMLLFMQGKLKVSGNPALAMRLQKIFDLDKPKEIQPPKEIPFSFRFEEPETTTGLRIQVVNMRGKPLPHRAHAGDAGYDLSFWPEHLPTTHTMLNDCWQVVTMHNEQVVRIRPGRRVLLPTGMKFAIPSGYYGHILDRSGNATKRGLHVLAGVIDSGYQGEIHVCLVNLSGEVQNIAVGDRIAQILFKRVETACFEEVQEFGAQTARGEKGYGSSGA